MKVHTWLCEDTLFLLYTFYFENVLQSSFPTMVYYRDMGQAYRKSLDVLAQGYELVLLPLYILIPTINDDFIFQQYNLMDFSTIFFLSFIPISPEQLPNSIFNVWILHPHKGRNHMLPHLDLYVA